MKQKEKISTLQQEKYSILDPFDQMVQAPNTLIIRINSHLETLSEDPLNIRDSEKIKFLNDTWRIRVGDYRILYTILPQRHAIGIVSIDDRKDVYESQEANANREEWFRELNLATNEQIRLTLATEDNPRKNRDIKETLNKLSCSCTLCFFSIIDLRWFWIISLRHALIGVLLFQCSQIP